MIGSMISSDTPAIDLPDRRTSPMPVGVALLDADAITLTDLLGVVPDAGLHLYMKGLD